MSDESKARKMVWTGAAVLAGGFILERCVSSMTVVNASRGIAVLANSVRLFKEILTPTIPAASEETLGDAVEPMYASGEDIPKNPPPAIAEEDFLPRGNGVFTQSYAEHVAMKDMIARQREKGTALFGSPDKTSWEF